MALTRGTSRWATAVVVGGGQAGLAASRHLSARGIDHVVLERGEIANSWRTERWDSLRLLTPNWQASLPGQAYRGDDPHGYMRKDELITLLDDYAGDCEAPVYTGTCVTGLAPAGAGYRVATNRGNWHCHSVVLATGPYNLPVLPALAGDLPASLYHLHAQQYRNPGQLPEGGVLVVGGSATGVQLAEELQAAGRQVTLAVGEHVRMPRRYRGHDIEYWLQVSGLLDESYREVDDLQRARRLPSPQLVGRADHRDMDLNALASQGIELVGRVAGLRDGVLQFSGALANQVKSADLKMGRMLDTIDDWIACSERHRDCAAADRPAPTRIAGRPRLSLDLGTGEIHSVLWATGFRPDYSWLQVPVLDRWGRIRHDGGVSAAPGLYAMGLPFMRRRKSASLFGAGDDARDIASHLDGYVRRRYRSTLVGVA